MPLYTKWAHPRDHILYILKASSCLKPSVILSLDIWYVASTDQEIPQSQTADKPTAPQRRATQPSRDTRKTI